MGKLTKIPHSATTKPVWAIVTITARLAVGIVIICMIGGGSIVVDAAIESNLQYKECKLIKNKMDEMNHQ